MVWTLTFFLVAALHVQGKDSAQGHLNKLKERSFLQNSKATMPVRGINTNGFYITRCDAGCQLASVNPQGPFVGDNHWDQIYADLPSSFDNHPSGYGQIWRYFAPDANHPKLFALDYTTHNPSYGTKLIENVFSGLKSYPFGNPGGAWNQIIFTGAPVGGTNWCCVDISFVDKGGHNSTWFLTNPALNSSRPDGTSAQILNYIISGPGGVRDNFFWRVWNI